MSDNNNADLARVEELLGDLVKSLKTESVDSDAAEVIAKGADAIVAETKEANDRISKSIDAIAEALTQLSVKVDALAETVHTKIEKSLSDIASQPVAPRSVQTIAETSPNEVVTATPAMGKDDVLNKALTELRTAEGERKLQILNAIARLDTNFAPSDIAAELNLR